MGGSNRITVSFVVRLTKEPREDDFMTADNGWRGLVQHVQSGHELRFLRMEELFRFIETTSQEACIGTSPDHSS